MLAAPGEHPVERLLVHALHRHRVDLDGEAGCLGGEDAVQRRLDLAPAGDLGEPHRVERIQRHVHPPHPSIVQRLRVLCQLRAVGGHRQLVQPVPDPPAQVLEQLHHVPPHQRLAAGDADLRGAQADEGGAETVEFLECQQVALRQEAHVFRHAIDATKVASVGHRDAQIGDGAAERVDHGRILSCLADAPCCVNMPTGPCPRSSMTNQYTTTRSAVRDPFGRIVSVTSARW